MDLLIGDDEVMIGGVIISGTEPKTVLIRARGPSLAAHDVPDTLADPFVQLFSGPDLIDQNNNWVDHENAGQIPPEFALTEAAEAAIVTTLAPGEYTAIERGFGETTGIGIVEVIGNRVR